MDSIPYHKKALSFLQSIANKNNALFFKLFYQKPRTKALPYKSPPQKMQPTKPKAKPKKSL